MKAILDIECTWTILPNTKKTNPSPYLADNKLVSVGLISFDDQGETGTDYFMFNHKELIKSCQAESAALLQDKLDKLELVIGHNLKFDMSWLYECGFTYNGSLYDTMIAEYVFCKGVKQPLSLAMSCERYGLEAKSDVLSKYIAEGINVDEMPLQELIDYGIQDLIVTKQLYHKQQELIATSDEHAYMAKAIKLMNETLPALIDMERNGICIDQAELALVETEYRKEHAELTYNLKEMIVEVMGAEPYNLDSSEDLSCILYSRKINSKEEWKDIFNLGTELRGSVRKVKYAKRYSDSNFINIVRESTTRLHKTNSKQCEVCHGAGRIRKTKKDGADFKKESICKECTGSGYLYMPLSSYAGYRITPLGSEFATIGGFSTDKLTLIELMADPTIGDKAKIFMKMLLRLNSIDSYLKHFVDGINKNLIGNVLHTRFNQCITATGRLSSSNPNFQNLPRGKTFPIRKVLISRFVGGKILSVDFKQLEFRVAALMANDEQAIRDLLNNVDIHQMTAEVIFNKPKKDCTVDEWSAFRQLAKAHTFKPLYGGIKGNPGEEAYYKAFLRKYKGIADWQLKLEHEALHTKQIKSPSGRIYAFPAVERLANGSVRGHTQIKNYIVQGFATGDINPVALINIHKEIKVCNLKSKLFLTVHDDISCDVHPDEVEIMITIYKSVFNNMSKLINDWFGITSSVPIEGDFSLGNNWLDKKEVA